MTPCPGSTSLTFACTTAPPLTAGYLGEIDAVSSTTVYLVGGRNSLLVTHDGGISWQSATSMIGDTSYGSWDVTFFNGEDGLVLGNDPNKSETLSIWSTTNGGATWRSVVPTEATAPANASAFAASSVSFTSPQDGWVLGVAPCSNRVCTRLLRTADGGSTWTQVPAPPAPLDTSKPSGINELHFADKLDAYAFGGTALWVTHDGGAHWRDLTSVGGLRRYVVGSLVSTTTGVFALVSGYGGPPGLGVGGSDTPWRILHAAPRSNRFRVVTTLTGNAGVPLTGTLASADGTVYALDGDSILRLAGTSTSSSPLPAGHLCQGPIAASGASSLLLVCGQGAADGSMGNRELFGTTDGGRSWTQLANPGMGAGYDTMGIADDGDGRATISTVSAGEGGLLNTTDSATSWTQVINFRGQEGAPFTDLSYQSSSQAVAVYGPVQARAVDGQLFSGIGALFKTTDGGKTWLRVIL